MVQAENAKNAKPEVESKQEDVAVDVKAEVEAKMKSEVDGGAADAAEGNSAVGPSAAAAAKKREREDAGADDEGMPEAKRVLVRAEDGKGEEPMEA
jgi:hypothetical protein